MARSSVPKRAAGGRPRQPVKQTPRRVTRLRNQVSRLQAKYDAALHELRGAHERSGASADETTRARNRVSSLNGELFHARNALRKAERA